MWFLSCVNCLYSAASLILVREQRSLYKNDYLLFVIIVLVVVRERLPRISAFPVSLDRTFVRFPCRWILMSLNSRAKRFQCHLMYPYVSLYPLC